MDPNLLPSNLRGQEQKEIAREKRRVPNEGDIFTKPKRRGKAAIDDESFRLSEIRRPAPNQAATIRPEAKLAIVNVAPQKDRHENLRQRHFGEKKVAPKAETKNNWHVPAEHALGDGWKGILKHPFGLGRQETEFHLADNKAETKAAARGAKPALAAAAPAAEGKKEQEKTHEQHQTEIHGHISKYFLWIAMPVLFAAVLYGLYWLLKILPEPFNLF